MRLHYITSADDVKSEATPTKVTAKRKSESASLSSTPEGKGRGKKKRTWKDHALIPFKQKKTKTEIS